MTFTASRFTLGESKHSRNIYFALDATKMQLPDFTRIITLSEAAARTGVSVRTLQKHVKAGTAPAHAKVGREVLFDRDEVLRWKRRLYPDGTPRKGRRRGE